MAQTFILASYCLGYLVICLSGYEVKASFEIERGKHDTFQNLLCETSQLCTNDQCKSYRAECVDNTECKRCRCDKNGKNTFLTSGSNTGNCTKDENIIPKSVPWKSFRLQKKKGPKSDQCLTVAGRGNNTIFGKSCSSSPSMRWISLKKSNDTFQLMNVMTLQCLEFIEEQSLCKSGRSHAIGQVAMKQCMKRDGQYMVRNNHYLYVNKLCGPQSYYLRLETKQEGKRYRAYSQRNREESWLNEDKYLRLLWEHIPYRGCYRFQNKGFMLYVDRKACREGPCSHQFSAPIFSDNKNCRINWSESKFLYSAAATWQNVSESIDTHNQLFSIERKSNDTQMLQVFHKASEKFNGSLFRLAISCENEMHPKESENQCLLLKFEFVRRNTTTLSPGAESTTDMYHDEKTTTASTSTTVKLKHKDTEESSINAVAIAVPVSLFAVILVVILIYFVCYRRQKREENLSKDQAGNINNPNYIQPSYEDPSKTYQTPASPGKQKASPATYEYIDNKDIAKQKQPELKYDYAINTEVPRINLGTQPNSNSGQPELNYDYAANTDVPKIPQNTKLEAELKYDYATNTELPRINLKTQPKAEGSAGQPELKYDYATNTELPRINLKTQPKAEGSAGQPELKYDYATNTELPRINLKTQPKAEGSAGQPELKYDYATNTEIQRINSNTQPKSDNAVDPATSPTYHALEEPNPPAPYYSTLDNPAADETKSLVNYDTPHSGDPVYNVLEESNDQN